MRSSLPRSPISTLVAPIGVGLVYAFARESSAEWGWPEIYWQGPFMFAFLGGILIGFAFRPLLSRVNWDRPTAFGAGLLLILGLGPWASQALALISQGLGATGFPVGASGEMRQEFFAALAAATLMALMYPPKKGNITLANLKERAAKKPLTQWLPVLSALSLAAVVVWLAFSGLDTFTHGFSQGRVFSPNSWNEITDTLKNNLLEGLVLMLFFWVRGLIMFSVLGLLPLVIKGPPNKTILMYALLIFVLKDFVPLMMNQPYPSVSWLTARTVMSLLEAAALGGLAARYLSRFTP